MKAPQAQVWRIVPDAGRGWIFSHRDSDFATLEPRENSSSSSLPSMVDLLLQAGPSSLPIDNGTSRMFQTGLGKPVAVKQSSIKRALSVLGEQETMDSVQAQNPIFRSSSSLIRKSDSSSMFQTGSGKPVAVKTSSIKMALSLFGEENISERDDVHKQALDTNSLFRTGSGKIVNVSSPELTKARTLLGLEENNCPSTSRGFEFMMKNTESLEKRSAIHSQNKPYSNHRRLEGFTSMSEEPSVKFQTARGRSISVSSDALERAMNLLGESEFGVLSNKVDADGALLPLVRERRAFHEVSLDTKSLSCSSWQQNAAMNNEFVQRTYPSAETFLGDDEKKQVSVDTVVTNNGLRARSTTPYLRENSSRSGPCMTLTSDEKSSENNFSSREFPRVRLSSGPLVEISNNICSESIDKPSKPGSAHANQRTIIGDKKRFGGGRSSVSPFKRPRRSRFAAPLNSSISCQAGDSSALENVSIKTRLSTRYPFHHKRKTLKEFFRVPPHHNLSENLSKEVKCMNADSAENYNFHTPDGSDILGPDIFQNMLVQSGASALNASKEWVLNHYKLIVWKLACLERSYPTLASDPYLTVTNVLEELKYRYEREVNHGHRSALKKIVEGDASSTTMMILCITGVHSHSDEKQERIENHMVLCEDPKKLGVSNGAANAKIELSDGWYSLGAVLDLPLSKLLSAGKLFVGQKIRVWGAGLCGWVGPISPLEASRTVNLVLHMNGTYRAHWADRLGFCKGFGAPLDFRCINSGGGLVPRTLVGVRRVYPVLYKERLTSGGCVVRSERMETKKLQEYNQRRSIIAEGIFSDSRENSTAFFSKNNNDSEEGAKLYKILERAAEPEVLMATMSSEKLTAFKTYQARQEALRQSDLQKMVEKALEDAGLSSRQVTPFMRVRVVGLTDKKSRKRRCPREGLVTIWQPTEKQVELVEGCIYSVAGLVPVKYGSDFLHLQARGSITHWKPLPQSATENFEPFFTPRKSVVLSNLGEVPLASEFDIAGVIVYVGELYASGHQKKQWVFVTDGSESGLESTGSSTCLLAINFCSSITGGESFAPVNFTLAGSTVGFFNLVKRARDQMNCLWVAEATENSTYSFCYNLPGRSHLKEAADFVRKWAKNSCSSIAKLREKVLCILGVCES